MNTKLKLILGLLVISALAVVLFVFDALRAAELDATVSAVQTKTPHCCRVLANPNVVQIWLHHLLSG